MPSMVSPRRPGLSLKVSFLLLALLLSLATVQYRWTGEVSRAERDRMQESLKQLVDHFTEDFDREMGRAFLFFISDPGRRPASVEDYSCSASRIGRRKLPIRR